METRGVQRGSLPGRKFQTHGCDGYRAYVLQVIPTLEKHGGEIIVAEYESEAIEGEPGGITVVTKSPSRDSFDRWYHSPEYQAIIGPRTDNSEGRMVVAGDFDRQKNFRILKSL